MSRQKGAEKEGATESPAERLRAICAEIRLEHGGVSRDAIARLIGRSSAYFGRMASGYHPVSRQTAELLQVQTGVSAQWLLTGRGERWADTARRDAIRDRTGAHMRPEDELVMRIERLERRIAESQSAYQLAGTAYQKPPALCRLRRASWRYAAGTCLLVDTEPREPTALLGRVVCGLDADGNEVAGELIRAAPLQVQLSPGGKDVSTLARLIGAVIGTAILEAEARP